MSSRIFFGKLAFVLLPVGCYLGAIQLMGACSSDAGTPVPTPPSSGKAKGATAPLTCAPNAVQQDLGDGKTWCCPPDALTCESPGAPAYHAACPEAGEQRTGRAYSFTEEACADGATKVKLNETWLAVAYECRSEDGIAPRWEYVEPSRHCSRVVQRTCNVQAPADAVVPAATTPPDRVALPVTTSDEQTGDLCDAPVP